MTELSTGSFLPLGRVFNRRTFLGCGVVASTGLVAGAAVAADGGQTGPVRRSLPAPRRTGGRPLLDVLNDRQSVRLFSPREIPERVLSDLLWAAFGVNRPATGQRTAPSTMNLQAIDVYGATAAGAWRYDAVRHELVVVNPRDLRLLTGGQDYVKVAPLALLFVADHRRMEKVPVKDRDFYTAADSGFISQNVYLFCASEGLGSVVHMPGSAAELGAALQLVAEQKVILAQAVGYAVPSAAG